MTWKNKVPNPTLSEIEKRAAEIRDGWDEDTRRRRFVGPLAEFWFVPVVVLSDMPFAFVEPYDES